MRARLLILGIALGCVLAIACQGSDARDAPDSQTPNELAEPAGLLLTWQRDPTSTMTIDWHTSTSAEDGAVLRYREVGDDEWEQQLAESYDHELFERTLLRAEASSLRPDTTYEFQVGDYERVYRFRTLPATLDERAVVFAAGGDTQHEPAMLHQMNRVAMEHDLDFVVWGGDLAYADGGANRNHQRAWASWFETNMDTLIDDDGRVVPIIVTVGNHEVVDGYYLQHEEFQPTEAWREAIAPYFYRLFAFPGQPGYGALDAGDYLTLVVLDTGHTNAIAGAQTRWLEEVLAERASRSVRHVLPIYHVPAYPSHRSFDGELSAQVREHWVPLFEAHGVRLAFENHDHAYKRTHPIRAGEVDPEGVVYLGDGAWGVRTRSGNARDAWYIDAFASERHAIIVTLDPDGARVVAVSDEGAILDEL